MKAQTSLLMTVVGIAGVAGYMAWPQPAPRISVDSTSCDFGEVDPAQPLAHVFRVTNTGRSTLVVSNVRSSCDCSKPQLSKSVLEPGQSEDLAVSFKFRQGNYSQVARIVVESNDPVSPKLLLELKARSSPLFELHPPHIFLGDIGVTQPHHVEHLVYCREGDAVRISVEDIIVPSPVAAHLIERPNERPLLDVSVDPQAALGPLTARLKVEIRKGGDGNQSETRFIAVNGTVVGPTSAVPSELNMGVLQHAVATRVRIVTAGPEDRRPLTAQVIGNIESCLRASIDLDSEGFFVEVEPQVPAGPPALRMEGVVQVGFDSPNMFLNIPVLAFAAPEAAE